MTRRLPSVLAGLAAAGLSVSLAPPRAEAYERQWHAGLGLGYAAVSSAGVKSGFGGGLHLTYGLTDAFNLMLEVDLTAHPKRDSFLLVPSASAGIGYVMDVLQWVPYIGLMGGAYDIWHQADPCDTPDPVTNLTVACHAARFGASVPFGLDYQVSRSFAVGFGGRYHLLFGGSYPGHYLTLFGRAEILWGY